MDDEKVESLLNSSAPNTPEKIAIQGSQGTRKHISSEESVRRRRVLSRLLASGYSDDNICKIMSDEKLPDGKPGFCMSPQSVKIMMNEIFNAWEDEDADREPYMKKAARRRLYLSIEKASQDGKWSAVANLEKVLSGIEGTSEPVEVQVRGDVRLTEAVLSVLGETDDIEVRKLIAGEKRLLDHSERIKLLPGGKEN